MSNSFNWDLSPSAFSKADAEDDSVFYAPARLVTHIDDGAIAALTRFYAAHLPSGGVVLDLMSSWVSHLPEDVSLSMVIGQGMNAEELDSNPRLTRRFIQDLNRDPNLPLDSESCDAGLCCVGVQYLQRPIEVFGEVARVLRNEAPFIVSFSNRCFPTKAVAIWQSLTARGKVDLIQHYMQAAGFKDLRFEVLSDGSVGDPLVAVIGLADHAMVRGTALQER